MAHLPGDEQEYEGNAGEVPESAGKRQSSLPPRGKRDPPGFGRWGASTGGDRQEPWPSCILRGKTLITQTGEPAEASRRRTVKIHLREEGKVCVLDLQGELKLGSGDEELGEAIGELLQGGLKQIVLNMKHVPWLDTSGMSALVVAKKRAVKQGGDVKLLSISPKVREELDIVRLLDVFETFENEAGAIESF
jgi:anti-sigma B factor antagonist